MRMLAFFEVDSVIISKRFFTMSKAIDLCANTEFSLLGNIEFIVKATDAITLSDVALSLTNKYKDRRGDKVYELTNHLGNVLATVSD